MANARRIDIPRVRAWMFGAVTAIVAVIGLLIAALESSLAERILGLGLFAMCGFIVIGFVRRLRRHEPLLVVRDDGLEHPDVGFIPWQDVTVVETRFGADGRSLVIGIANAHDYARRNRSRVLRLFAHVGATASLPAMSFPELLLPTDAESLRAEIERRRGGAEPASRTL